MLPGAVIPTNVVYINQGGEKGKTMGSQIGRAAIAEFGSLQVEFLALSQRTANTSYGETAEALPRLLYQKYPDKVVCFALKGTPIVSPFQKVLKPLSNLCSIKFSSS